MVSVAFKQNGQPYVPIFWTGYVSVFGMANKNNGDIGFGEFNQFWFLIWDILPAVDSI
jgi:hypothetical protein